MRLNKILFGEISHIKVDDEKMMDFSMSHAQRKQVLVFSK
jgi:hypothetical protein